jgi:hypothetical protein
MRRKTRKFVASQRPRSKVANNFPETPMNAFFGKLFALPTGSTIGANAYAAMTSAIRQWRQLGE